MHQIPEEVKGIIAKNGLTGVSCAYRTETNIWKRPLPRISGEIAMNHGFSMGTKSDRFAEIRIVILTYPTRMTFQPIPPEF